MVRAFVSLGVVIVVVAAFNRVHTAEVATPRSETLPEPTAVGSSQCLGCHGTPDAKALTQPLAKDHWKYSATIFHAVDPHRQAYNALLSEKAVKMIAHLRRGDASYQDAQLEIRCLACHTTPAAASNPALRSDGISCEACHGPASLWLAPHTVEGFDRKIAGFRDLKLHAAATCASCHIGDGSDPVRDMNHDIIAAGHPALRDWKEPQQPGESDFSDLLSRYPKHWDSKAPLDNSRAFPLAWKELSKSRQVRKAPQPEFAEMDCIQCHRNLQPK